MLNSHMLWEQILFDHGYEDRIIRAFTAKAQSLSAGDAKPQATDVVQALVNTHRRDLYRKMTPPAEGPGEIIASAVNDALHMCPDTLIEEVAEHAKEDLAPEQEDVCLWDV